MARELDTGGDTTVSLSHLTRRRASVETRGDRRGPLRRLMGHVGVAPDQGADPRRVVMVGSHDSRRSISRRLTKRAVNGDLAKGVLEKCELLIVEAGHEIGRDATTHSDEWSLR